MKALAFNDFGGPENLKLQDVPDPTIGPDEVLVSSTVRDLVAGSGLAFADRGLHTLKGVPGDWHLFAVDRGVARA